MDKKELKKAFKDFSTSATKKHFIIRLGYTNAPDNYMKYSDDAEAYLLALIRSYKIKDYKREAIQEYGYIFIRYLINY